MKSQNAPYWGALLLAALAAVALTIDVPVARFCQGRWMVGDFKRLLSISEVFAHGFGVALILVTVAVLDRSSWRRLPRVAACSFGAGLIAQCSKHLLPRIRPYAFDLSQDVWDSFVSLSDLPHANWLDAMQRGAQSFPSGHTATAVGLAFGLTWLYPRGRWLFPCFATLAALQRIEAAAHFLSDTLAAAAIGCVVAGLCLDNRAVGKLFDRWERTTHDSSAN